MGQSSHGSILYWGKGDRKRGEEDTKFWGQKQQKRRERGIERGGKEGRKEGRAGGGGREREKAEVSELTF